MRISWILVFLAFFLGCAGDGAGNGSEGSGVETEAGVEGAAPVSDTLGGNEGLVPQDSLSATDSLLVADSRTGPAADTPELSQESAGLNAEDAFTKPDSVRGIYLNAWAAGSTRRREALVRLARQTELNSFVIDIKDATGFISHPTGLRLAGEVGATGEVRIRDLAALLARLKEAGIYPIARIVVAKDPLLTEGRPDLAIQDSAGGVWSDQDGVHWLNLYHPEVWDYHVDLAKEVVRAGFPEIQWDYVRFPDAPEALRARQVFPESEGLSLTEAVRAFLGYSRRILEKEGASVTADVFGVTTSYRRDVGIGQVWEMFIDQVDAALPMVYPSHYWTGSFGYESPNAYPYEIVRRALRDAVSRSALVDGAGKVRPWLQDFSLGDPLYDAPEVRAQIQATYDAGVEEWILWNPGSRYTESALMPAGGLPSWLEPRMRVGGEVVPLSQRYEILGEEAPEGEDQAADTIALPDLALPSQPGTEGLRTLPVVPIPDTVPDTVGVRAPELFDRGSL